MTRKNSPENDGSSLAGGGKGLPGQGKISQEDGNVGAKDKEPSEGVKPPCPNQSPEEVKPSTLSLQTVRSTELRRRLGQNTAFLPTLEKALTKVKESCQSSKRDPDLKESNEDRCVVWLIEDTIQWIKEGTFHLN